MSNRKVALLYIYCRNAVFVRPRDEVKASANPSKAKPNNKCERLLSYFPRNALISLRCFFASLRPV